MEMPGNRNSVSRVPLGTAQWEPGMGMPGNRNRRSESRQGRHSRSPAWECRETETSILSPRRNGAIGSSACRQAGKP